MPATEDTLRNIPVLHRIFAVSGVLLLITTLWVLASDHNREWKNTQTQVVYIDTTMNHWRQQQFRTDEATSQHEATARALLLASAANVPAEALERFSATIRKFEEELAAIQDSEPLAYNAEAVEDDRVRLAEAAAAAEQLDSAASQAKLAAATAQKEYEQFRAAAKKDDDEKVKSLRAAADAAHEKAAAAQTEAERALHNVASKREKLIAKLDAVVVRLRAREDIVLGLRKFQSAKLDAAKARVDIAVRDNLPLAGPQSDVEKEAEAYQKLNLRYQVRNVARVGLQQIVADQLAGEAAAKKEVETAVADLKRLEEQFAQRQQTYFVKDFPFLGKRILTLPILNAFGSPLKVENLWSEGLVQDVNFKKVRRFDRCTTCHQLMQRTMPGAPTDPAYIRESLVEAWIHPPAALPEGITAESPVKEQLEKAFGLHLAEEGLVNFDDVTVSLVLPNSPAASARVVREGQTVEPALAEDIRYQVAAFTPQNAASSYKVIPGLTPGDVIVGVGADRITSAARVGSLLLDAVGSKEPVRLLVRRGLPEPYTSHPRLDLYVGDSSPHPMGTFGCTICHEGQGNATAFKWTSHTPNDGQGEPDESLRWTRDFGWFDNHHWIYPMFPARFAESGCLKCHHDVTELERSERYPEPPAPKLTHGYHLIRKYGCYGCHEINGYDGPTKRVGPDLRLEPNFFAAALQLRHLLPPRISALEEQLAKADDDAARQTLRERLQATEQVLELAGKIGQANFADKARSELRLIVEHDQSLAEADRVFTPAMLRLVEQLKDIEVPGALRKPGPSLRYVKEKLDPAFIYDWTQLPRRFRPTTRMPQVFQMWDHLQDDPASLHLSEHLEPVELQSIVAYLQNGSQSFIPLKKPEGIVPVADEEEQIERGKALFETRGCLACHQHQDFKQDVENDDDTVFPGAHRFRGEKEIVQGPDLSRIAAKFDPQRNPGGRDWLYSWIKEPTRYHPRTLMPNLFLDPIASKVKGDDGKETTVYTDPVDDIVSYLLDPAHLKQAGAWEPVPEATQPLPADDLKRLTTEYLRESFPERVLDQYYENGIPEALRKSVKEAERDLIVPPGEKLTDQHRLQYLGRRTIAKYGCFGCHDIPGFEDAKPIGVGLADWGRKDPSKLAFEHIAHYVAHGDGHAAHGEGEHVDHGSAADHGADAGHEKDAAHGDDAEHATSAGHGVGGVAGSMTESRELPLFYERALHHQHRESFIYQKLKEPRSYDYRKAQNKKYNDRLRMPKFPFNSEEREAVITFVLGLVADPPGEKYLYRPSERQAAIIAGKQVLETYNCGSCHVLEGERWDLAFTPDTFEEQSAGKTYPFMARQFDAKTLAHSAKTDARGRATAAVHGLPATAAASGLPLVFDEEDGELEDGEKYSPASLKYSFDLYAPVALGGNAYQTGPQSLRIPADAISRQFASEGGFLAKYLLPIVSKRLAKTAGTGKGREALGWLPPPLMGEGAKVQTSWLHDFLLEPYRIRPAAVLRMPKFNLSSDDAAKLVNYFAAVDNAEYPYEAATNRQSDFLQSQQERYEKTLAAEGQSKRGRLDDAMQIVVNQNFCVKCHIVGDFQPEGADQAKGPNLARVYERLRPDYLRRWIAKPTMILPYTSMPENIPYDPAKPHLGGVDQNLFHGTSIEQVDGLVDLLMNYDEFAKSKTLITPLVPKSPGGGQPVAAGQPAAAEEGKGADETKRDET